MFNSPSSDGLALFCIAQWLRGRTSNSRLREPGFESCAAVLKPWASFSLYIGPVHSAVYMLPREAKMVSG